MNHTRLYVHTLGTGGTPLRLFLNGHMVRLGLALEHLFTCFRTGLAALSKETFLTQTFKPPLQLNVGSNGIVSPQGRHFLGNIPVPPQTILLFCWKHTSQPQFREAACSTRPLAANRRLRLPYPWPAEGKRWMLWVQFNLYLWSPFHAWYCRYENKPYFLTKVAPQRL